jgi:cell division protein FtsW
MRRLAELWQNPAEAIFYVVLILLIIGTVNIFSASFVMAQQTYDNSYFFLNKHFAAFAVGIICLFLVVRIDYHRWQLLTLLMVLVTVGLLLAVHLNGLVANGARRWLKLGITFQPSELAKLTAVFAAATYLGPRLKSRHKITLVSWPVMASAIMGFLVLRQPDMGTAAVIVGLCLILYIIVGLPRREFLTLLGGGLAGITYLVFAAGYRAERIAAWIDPWAYQQTTGYQTVQSLLAIGSGGLFGTGLGMGASKFHYLPEAHTDFAFAVLCQELGFVGATVVLFLFAALAWHGVKIALQAPDGFGALLATGMTILVVGQAIGNIAMVSGVFPVTGVPLPFISFGGTSLIVNMIAVGLLINIGRCGTDKTEPDEQPRRPARKRRLALVSK